MMLLHNKVFKNYRNFSSQCSFTPSYSSKSTQYYMKLCDKHLANNYKVIPVVLEKGRGCYVFDVDGRKYLDFLSGFAAVSQGHCHPKICKAIIAQARELTHVSRSFLTKPLAEYSQYVTKLFGYDNVLPCNGGVETGETAIKLARKWGYKCKGIKPNQAKVIFAENNFWGRTIAAVSSSTDPDAYLNYGPYVPGFETVPFNDPESVAVKLRDPNVCAIMLEPVQGEAGVVIPSPDYLKKVRDICTENNVLFIADEVQCGLGRCGSLVCCDLFHVRPDILLLAKSLSGGFMPIGAVLADKNIMDAIEPGTHGSTFGGCALSCKVAMAALDVIIEEKLPENAELMGQLLREYLKELPRDVVVASRGMGLFNAIVISDEIPAWDLCLEFMKNGLLTKPTRGQIIRLSPPLTITEEEVLKAGEIIKRSIENMRKKMKKQSSRECLCQIPTHKKMIRKAVHQSQIVTPKMNLKRKPNECNVRSKCK